ncbi:hypothetical protein J2T58_000990 [Methanocalculus alkaliphilus]|uniref:hypothetical protein n=1 Tax=Methanocalculus alkaliphilus TaxID=768730 RepID=UPI0020A0FBBA|nr:hypothetical protein [Methanocalculus alkaliphilus]MCP1715136.1 hypothetical protein [Methanocalculus alkaliphilus]
MDKQDIMTFIGGLVFVVIIAVVINPMVTGESPDFSIPPMPGAGERGPQAVVTPPPTAVPLGQISIPHPSTVQAASTKGTMAQVWDGQPIRLGYVDPGTYHLTRPDSSIPARRPIETDDREVTLQTFATIEGRWSGASQVFEIPSPRWELWYTVNPSVLPTGSGQSVGYPRFIITVMDAEDPNRVVRTIDPAGGGIIDERLWSNNDPRPWKESFLEGGRSYYLIIESRLIESYTIEAKVPVQ